MALYPAQIDPALDLTLEDDVDPDDLNELDARTRALEAKVGADGSQALTSHEYRLRALEQSLAEISVAGMVTIPGDGGAWHTIGSWRFDPAQWPSGVTLSLRAEGSVGPTEALAGQLRLVRASDGTVDLDGIQWTGLEVTSETDVWEAPLTATVYLVQARHDASAASTESLTVYGVRAVVQV